jgi:Fe-S-cluster containining protein
VLSGGGKAGVDVHFDCTQCGRCCHDTKVPLTLQEAADWLADGHSVQVVCEAWSWLEDRSGSDRKLAYLKHRSFEAASGGMPARVVATLVANIEGPCPNLDAERRCTIYTRRPLVCRIYPAEINPFMKIDPAMKSCPPEAWATDRPKLMQAESLMNAQVRRDIGDWLEALGPEAKRKNRLCTLLRLADAAIAQEGFLVHSPPREVLLDAISQVMRDEGPAATAPSQWRLITDRPESIDKYAAVGASVCHAGTLRSSQFHYIGLRR